MDIAIIRSQAEKLKRRRDHLAAALRDLWKELTHVEQNPDWVDQAANETRVDFVDRLRERYLTEIGQIDGALDRIESRQYGLCLACHEAIEPHRLESAPETEYCSYCQNMREAVLRG